MVLTGVLPGATAQVAPGADAPSGLVKRAAQFARRSQYPQAVELLDRAIRAAASHREAFELRGYCRMKLRDYDGAVQDFRRGTPQAVYHAVNYGFCLRKLGRLPEALAAFREAAGALRVEDPWGRYARAQVRTLQPFAEARTVLVLLDAGEHLVARLGTEELGRAGRDTEVAFSLDGKLTDRPQSLRLVAITTHGPPSGRAVILDRGRPVLSVGRPFRPPGPYDLPLEGISLRAAVSLRRGADGVLHANLESAGPDLDAARREADQAEQEWARGARDAALDRLAAAGARYPTLAWFPERLASLSRRVAADLAVTAATRKKRVAILERGRLAAEAALEVRRKVAALVPADLRAQLRAATAATAAGALPEAEHHYRAVLGLNASHPVALAGLSQTLVRLGRAADAVRVANQAIESRPRWPYAHVARADALAARGEVPGALLSYSRAVELDPTQGEWIYGKIALVVNRGGANGVAIAAAEERVRQAPLDPQALALLGGALLRGLRFEEAVSMLDQARSAGAKGVQVVARAALAAELAGKARSALERYRIARDVASTAGAASADPLAALARRRGRRIAGLVRALRDAPPELPPAAIPLADARPASVRERAERALAGRRASWPRLAEGLARLPPLADGALDEADAIALERIARAVTEAGADRRTAGLVRLLQATVPPVRRSAIAIDGAAAGWTAFDRLATDAEGDAEGARGPAWDIAEVSAVCMADHLYLALRVQGRPDPGRVGYWFELRGEPTHGTLAVGVQEGQVRLVRARPNREPRQRAGARTGVTWRAGEVLELRVPMRWLRGARRVSVRAYTFDAQAAVRVDEIAEQRPIAPTDDGYSPALLSLYELARRAPLEAGDRIALAIALESGEAMAIGGTVTHARVAADDRRFLALARRLDAAPRREGWPRLRDLPLPALLTWACRSVQHRPSTPAGYLRYTVSPGALVAMGAFLRERKLVRPTAGETVEAIERYLASPLRWQYTSAVSVERGGRLRRGQSAVLSEIERRSLNKFLRACTVDGMKVTTDGYFNQDLLFDHLLATDALVGHCGNLAQLTVDLCRSIGIPATIVQGREEQSPLAPNPHAFPVYFDGRGWRSFQGERYRGERPLTLYLFLPLAPSVLPGEARPTGVGTHWVGRETTYDEAGAWFQSGFPAGFLDRWLRQAARR